MAKNTAASKQGKMHQFPGFLIQSLPCYSSFTYKTLPLQLVWFRSNEQIYVIVNPNVLLMNLHVLEG